jgi:hypothetical protein
MPLQRTLIVGALVAAVAAFGAAACDDGDADADADIDDAGDDDYLEGGCGCAATGRRAAGLLDLVAGAFAPTSAR